MHFTEVAELEDKVSLLRSERMLTVAAAELSNPSGGFAALDAEDGAQREAQRQARLKRAATAKAADIADDRLRDEDNQHQHQHQHQHQQHQHQQRGGLFGTDPVVARLFASSPPDHTFTLEDDDDLRDDHEEVLSFPKWRESAKKQTLRRARSENAQDDPETPTEIRFEAVAVADDGSDDDSSRDDRDDNRDDEDRGGKLDDPGKPSGISRLLGSSRSAAVAGRDPGAGSPGHRLVIYLPDLKPVNVTVPLGAKVSDVIQTLLDNDRRTGGGRNVRLYPDASKYELRLHDEDGLPDLDFPACDADMDVENLCEGLDPEFCICPKAGADVDLDNLPDSDEEDTIGTEDSHVASLERLHQRLKEQSARLVKITLPENDFQTSVKCTPGMTAVDLLRIIHTKQRLPIFTEEYLFTVSEDERVDLGLMSRKVEMKTDLYAANIRQLELSRRQYADTPSQDPGADRIEPEFRHRDRGSSAAIHDDGDAPAEPVTGRRHAGQHRFNPDNVLFNDQTARHYEEWDVIKTNKWGKRQRRVLGIDHQKVYNKKQEKDLGKNMLSKDTVKRAERDIADVKTFRICQDDPTCIEIRWKAPGDASAIPGGNTNENNKDELTLKYEVAKGPEAAARIIAKLQYLRRTG